jgi:energy-coupling factor transporter ATP-binding protein EcfA2
MPYQLTTPALGERLWIVGNPGTGKSKLATSLLAAVPDAIILDTKHDEEESYWGPLGRIVRGEDIYNVAEGRFVWDVPDSYTDDPEKFNIFFKWALGVGRRVIYVDEFNDICGTATRYPYWFRRCYSRGRSRKLSMWGTTQELIRALGSPTQRKLADEYMGTPIPWLELPEPSPATVREGTAYRFVYKGPGTGMVGPVRLAE